MQTVNFNTTYAPGINAPVRATILWLLGISNEKLQAFVERTLADWLMTNYPDYEYHTWALSYRMKKWWWQRWWQYDAMFIKELQQVDFRERWEWYRMLHQYLFSHTDIKAKQLLADFETAWPQYVEEIKAAEANEKICPNA